MAEFKLTRRDGVTIEDAFAKGLQYTRVAAAFYGQPWAILPEKLIEMEAVLRLRMRGEHVSPERIAEVMAARASTVAPRAGRIGIIPVQGVISQRISSMEQASGGVSAEDVGRQLDGMMADESVKCIVMPFDSPGGSVFGIAELAGKIQSARSSKKIYGIADSLAASAAYWCISQCTEVSVCPGGLVGSIGVITLHADYSEAMAAEGVKATLIYAGKYKAEGNPYEPLDAPGKDEMQSKVDQYYSQFISGVAAGRRVSQAKVKSDFGQGRVMMDSDAVKAGMADQVETTQELLQRLGGSGSGTDNPRFNGQAVAARARAVEVENA